MSPNEVSAVIALAGVFEKINHWPFGLVLFMLVIGPWILAMLLAYMQKKRFEAVVDMYKSNVRLVEKYEKVANDLKDMIVLNTQTITRLVDNINNNQFCPMVRLEKQAKGVQE